jgi:SPP1 family predicted phage head-tail adaptor
VIYAGKLRFTLTIEEPSTQRDDAGQPLDEWTTFATRRGAIDRKPGAELVAAAARIAKVPTFFRLRYLGGVVPGMRLREGARTYDVKSAVDPDGLKRELVIIADELEASS